MNKQPSTVRPSSNGVHAKRSTETVVHHKYVFPITKHSTLLKKSSMFVGHVTEWNDSLENTSFVYSGLLYLLKKTWFN